MLTKENQQLFYDWLGEQVKKARNAQGMTQEKLANQINLTRVSVANIEKGKQKVQIHTLIEIAYYLKISFTELYEKSIAVLKINEITEIEKKIKNEVNPGNLESIRKINEFINFSIKKGNK